VSIPVSTQPRWTLPKWLGPLSGLGALGLLGLAAGLVIGYWLLSAILNPPEVTPAVTASPVVLESATRSPEQGENSSTTTALAESASRTAAVESTRFYASLTAEVAALRTFEAKIATQTALVSVPLSPEGMVLIPAGEFQMGSENGESDEKPVHTVSLDAFYIDFYEVTNARYAECVNSGDCTSPHETKSYSRSSYYNDSQYADYPVIYVDWSQAQAYCQWRGGDLPTEAQWEYAARGDWKGKTTPGVTKNRSARRVLRMGLSSMMTRTATIPTQSPSAAIPPMVMACSTWLAMSGNGCETGMPAIPQGCWKTL
jgi:formylglycine-generating enzyme required for sulfatase activity